MSKSGNLSGLEGKILSHVKNESEAVRVREQKIAALETQLWAANRENDVLKRQVESSHRAIEIQGEQKAQLMAASRDTGLLSALYRGNEEVSAVFESMLDEMLSSHLTPRQTAKHLTGVIWGHRLKLLAQQPTQGMLNAGRLWTRFYPNETDVQVGIWKAMYDAA